MGIPLLVLAFPPLLVLYPTSYTVWLLRTLFARRIKTPKLLSDGKFVDPRVPHHEHNDPSYAAAAAATPLIARVGEGKLGYCEDVLVWHLPRTAIFSSDPSRPVYNPFTNTGNPAAALDGGLLLYDLDSRKVQELPISGFPSGRTFHPVGLGIRENENDAVLAVCNLGKKGGSVEIIRLHYNAYAEKHRITATYVHSLEASWLTTPNAVVPLSEESVLVTNSFGFSARKHSILNQIETLCALPFGSLLYLSKGEYITREEKANVQVVSGGIALANGVALSPDGRLLLVAGCTSANLHVYDIDPPASSVSFDSDNVRFRETIPVDFNIDNLRFQEATANSYVFLGAGHPVPLAFVATASSNGKKLAPSRAVKITVAAHHAVRSSIVASVGSWLNKMFTRVDPRVQTIFEDSGELLSASATAVGFTGRNGRKEMLVTGLWDSRGAVHCIEVDI